MSKANREVAKMSFHAIRSFQLIRILTRRLTVPVLSVLAVLAVTAIPAQADPHPGQSVNVGVIANTNSINGGTLPTTTTGPTGSFTSFTFTNLAPVTVNAVTLAPFDTVLLNVASSGMNCNINTLTASQKTDIVNFLNGGGKLIIYDSECSPQDYSWLPNPFATTNSASGFGGSGTVNIVEDNFLGTDNSTDSHFINETTLGQNTDAVGDMNVLTTQDPDICLHMSGTNAANETGATHVYYKSGSGLLIYNGFDIDFSSSATSPDSAAPAGNIAKIWLQELQQPLDGSNLSCGVVVTGISLSPTGVTNDVNTSHTVTATVTEQGAGKPNVLVTFTVTGANAGATGTCNPASCQTDANGQVTFTYTGTNAGQDQIEACFTEGGTTKCATATKEWESTGPGPPATLDLSPATATNTAGDQHCVTAHVEDASGNPTPGHTVQFSVSGANGPLSGSATTDSNGDATFCYTGTNAGDDTINAFADTNTNGTDDGASEPDDTAAKTYVAGDPATLTLAPKTATNPVDSQHCVTATNQDAYGNPTPGITDRFSVTGSVTTSGSQTTDANGQAQFCYTGPALPGSDVIKAYADTNTNNTQDPGEPSDTAAKTWTLPSNVTPCVIKITNGGWIITDDGDRGSFGGNAKESSTGVDTGQEEYQDHGPAEPLNAHSLNVLAITCNATLTKASIFGQMRINGTGSHYYRIDVEDNGEPGKGKDHYRIRLDTGYDSGDHILRGGNVQIH
jgi:hypothetical protein